MSKIADSLKSYASVEKQAHEEYIKDFTAVAIAQLVQGGVDREQANLLAKEACFRNEELVKAIKHTNILEKVAEYLVSLEDEVANLQAKISTSPEQNEKQAEIPEHLKKLSSLGFTDEEIEHLQSVPQSLIEKVAGAASEPWEMGRGVGASNQRMDPLLDFLLG